VPPVPPVPPVRVRVRVPVPVTVPEPEPVPVPVRLHGMQLPVQPPQLQLVAARIQMPDAPAVPEVLLPELTAQGPRTEHPGRRIAGRAWRPALEVSNVGT
jgi:hypothetical protein